ncbi:hypothetical protein KSF73_09840 [Burkholderiaceae bacterium DAT-1]|nr:hypothetical protein [Burkholderiaceae bacterium DAT-1]
MELSCTLQYFALDQAGNSVAIQDVPRGLACECYCPACGHSLVAKKGNVKAWHFAHASGSDCASGAMTALHLAAQQMIKSESKMMLPILSETYSSRALNDALVSRTETQNERLIHFEEVTLEKHLGDIRPDAIGIDEISRYFIEVAVTHFVDEEKRNKIILHNEPALEINLSLVEVDTWDTLHQAVISGVEYKNWIHHPDLEVMQTQAKRAVEIEIQAINSKLQNSQKSSSTINSKWSTAYSFGMAKIYLDEFEYHIRIRQINYIHNTTFIPIHKLIYSLGGQRTGDRFWKVPRNKKEQLISGLNKICTAFWQAP